MIGKVREFQRLRRDKSSTNGTGRGWHRRVVFIYSRINTRIQEMQSLVQPFAWGLIHGKAEEAGLL